MKGGTGEAQSARRQAGGRWVPPLPQTALLLAISALVWLLPAGRAAAQNADGLFADEPKLQQMHRLLVATPAGDLFRLIAEKFQPEYLGFLYELRAADEAGDRAAGFKLGQELISTIQSRHRRAAKHAAIPTILAKVEAEIDLVETMARLHPVGCRNWVSQAFVPNLPEVLHPANIRHTLRFFAAMAEGRDRPIDHGEMTDADATALAQTLDREGVSREEIEIVAAQGWDRLADDRDVCGLYARFLRATLKTPRESLAPVLATLLSE